MSFIDMAADGVIDEAADEDRIKTRGVYDFDNLGASQRQIRNNRFTIIEQFADDRDESPTSGLGASSRPCSSHLANF